LSKNSHYSSKKKKIARQKAHRKWLAGRRSGKMDCRNKPGDAENIPREPSDDEHRGFNTGFNMGWNAAKKEYKSTDEDV